MTNTLTINFNGFIFSLYSKIVNMTQSRSGVDWIPKQNFMEHFVAARFHNRSPQKETLSASHLTQITLYKKLALKLHILWVKYLYYNV